MLKKAMSRMFEIRWMNVLLLQCLIVVLFKAHLMVQTMKVGLTDHIE